jgi:hypothetical protein
VGEERDREWECELFFWKWSREKKAGGLLFGTLQEQGREGAVSGGRRVGVGAEEEAVVFVFLCLCRAAGPVGSDLL